MSKRLFGFMARILHLFLRDEYTVGKMNRGISLKTKGLVRGYAGEKWIFDKYNHHILKQTRLGMKGSKNGKKPQMNKPEEPKASTEEYRKLRKTISSLQKSEEKHQSILEEIEEGYLEADIAGRIKFCNQPFCRITGYSLEELRVMGFREYMTEDVAKIVYKVHNKVYKTGVPHKGFRYEIIRKDGAKRIIENSISLVRDANNDPIGFRSIVRDITDRIQMEEEKEKHRNHLQAIFETVKDAIVMVDSEMVVVEANDAIENICGLESRNIVGMPIADGMTQCGKNCCFIIQKALKSNGVIEETSIRCDHILRPQQRVAITSSPIRAKVAASKGQVIVIRDITRLSNLEQELGARHQFQNIIGKNSKLQDIYNLLDDLADLETTVLITGESGTGKSIIARALHYSGQRAAKPMITVNCSALPEELLESELFGHVRGAFTGAVKDTPGRFQVAKDGTVLLDEIGDISQRIQLKLLRVLQEKEFERVGESVPIKMEARLIACTNKNLKEKVRQGLFREDLYYRLKVIELRIPPLRERSEDIPLLVDHFCGLFNKSFQKNIKGISDEVMKVFMTYNWPGNVRELEHCIEHAFVLCRDPMISLHHLPSEIMENAATETKPSTTHSEDTEILKILDKTYWNKAKAARLLGMDRSTLYRKIQKYRLQKSAS